MDSRNTRIPVAADDPCSRDADDRPGESDAPKPAKGRRSAASTFDKHLMSLPLDADIVEWLAKESTRRRLNAGEYEWARRSRVGIIREAMDELIDRFCYTENPPTLRLRDGMAPTKPIQFHLNDEEYAAACAIRDRARSEGRMAYLSDVVEHALLLKMGTLSPDGETAHAVGGLPEAESESPGSTLA